MRKCIFLTTIAAVFVLSGCGGFHKNQYHVIDQKNYDDGTLKSYVSATSAERVDYACHYYHGGGLKSVEMIVDDRLVCRLTFDESGMLTSTEPKTPTKAILFDEQSKRVEN